MSDIEEPDRLLDFLHPRENTEILGHEDQMEALHRALASNRFPHAWIFSGPRGIGKATLAYRLTRFILKYPPGTIDSDTASNSNLEIPPNDIIFQQVSAQSHPSLKVVKRPYDQRTKRIKTEITVAEIRNLHRLFMTTTTDGGWRIALIDSADEMNRNAANALLKVLEEPPAKSVLILISHQSGKLLPTIKSRCRMLPFNTLDESHVAQIMSHQLPSHIDLSDEDHVKIARLAKGSANRALQFASGSGLKIHNYMIELLETLPNLNGAKAHQIAEQLSRRDSQDEFRFFKQLFVEWLNTFVRFCTTGEGAHLPKREFDLCQRLAIGVDLEPWLEVWEKTVRSLERADVLNLDKRQLLLNMFFQLETVAKQSQRS